MIPLSGEDTRRISAQLVGVIGVPTVIPSPESHRFRLKGVTVVLQVFEGVNGSGTGARVPQSSAPLFKAKT